MKKYITILLVTSLNACNQELPKPPTILGGIENTTKLLTLPNTMPEVNDKNCKFEYMKSITDKVIQQKLADKCASRSTIITTEHKNWVF